MLVRSNLRLKIGLMDVTVSLNYIKEFTPLTHSEAWPRNVLYAVVDSSGVNGLHSQAHVGFTGVSRVNLELPPFAAEHLNDGDALDAVCLAHGRYVHLSLLRFLLGHDDHPSLSASSCPASSLMTSS